MSVAVRAAATCGLAIGLIGYGPGHLTPAQGEPPGRLVAAPAEVQDQPQLSDSHDTFDASRDAQERFERKRRGNIDRQLNLLEQMRWHSGLPYPGRWPPSLDYIYGRGLGPVYRPGVNGAYRSYNPSFPDVFEPWPFVPGDIYGYGYLDQVEQPLGHKVIEAGPDRQITQPIYQRDLESPQPAPEPAPEGGPREF